MKHVRRTQSYRDDLRQAFDWIKRDSPAAAARLRLLIDDQVSQLADPNFPRRPGRIEGTKELVAHPSYVVVLAEDDTTVTALSVVHAAQRFPPE